MNKENIKQKTKPTDEDAMRVVNSQAQSKVRICDTWVPRTVLYAASIEYKPGVETTEIRPFVRQGEWCNSRQWERALELEKEFGQLNKKYAESLKAAGKPVNIKTPKNFLNATPLGLN